MDITNNGKKEHIFKGELETLDDFNFDKIVSQFFSH